jgi:hypothetical protein
LVVFDEVAIWELRLGGGADEMAGGEGGLGLGGVFWLVGLVNL